MCTFLPSNEREHVHKPCGAGPQRRMLFACTNTLGRAVTIAASRSDDFKVWVRAVGREYRSDLRWLMNRGVADIEDEQL